jgi:hypothetical protein
MEQNKVDFFRNSLKEARAVFIQETNELSGLESRVYWLKDDLSKLRKTITALAAMCSETPWSYALGITDSCMEAMTVERATVSTKEVTQRLESMGFDLSSQKNPAASVHAVLTRLAEKGQIKKITDDNGEVTWRGPNFDEDYAQQMEISDDDIPF